MVDAEVQRHGGSDARCSSEESLKCPECGSKLICKDGLRYLEDGSTVQRYLCRHCGYRFSEKEANNGFKPLKETSDWPLKASETIASNRQICAILKEAKNLAPTTETKTVAGERTTRHDAEGLITQFMAWCEAQGYPSENKYHYYLRRLVRLGADLTNPENVKEVIGKHKCKNGTKMLFCYAYDAFTRMLKIQWDAPKYRQEETLPFIAEESELDSLISACRSRRMAAFLQFLKETFADPGEALRI